MSSRKEINDALMVIDELCPLLDEAEKKFQNARGLGILDMFGGGLLTDILKHSQMQKGKNLMYDVNDLLARLKDELDDINIPSNCELDTGKFATFADFFFDGILSDVFMQSKINMNIDKIKELRYRINILEAQLQSMLRTAN